MNLYEVYEAKAGGCQDSDHGLAFGEYFIALSSRTFCFSFCGECTNIRPCLWWSF